MLSQKPYNENNQYWPIVKRLFNRDKFQPLTPDEQVLFDVEVNKLALNPVDMLNEPIKVGDWICSAMATRGDPEQTIGVIVAIDLYKGIQIEQRVRTDYKDMHAVGGKKVWLKETNRMIKLGDASYALRA